MTRFRATSIPLFLTVAALALGACGGDDSGSTDSVAAGTDTTETTTGTTETGTTESGTSKTGTTETRERTTKKERKSSSGGSGGSGDSGSGKSGSGKSGNSGKSPEKQLTGKNIFTTSKTVCSNFLPTALAKDLKEGKKSAEDIAKDYSAGYPSAERKRAYDGCLAGLKANE